MPKWSGIIGTLTVLVYTKTVFLPQQGARYIVSVAVIDKAKFRPGHTHCVNFSMSWAFSRCRSGSFGCVPCYYSHVRQRGVVFLSHTVAMLYDVGVYFRETCWHQTCCYRGMTSCHNDWHLLFLPADSSVIYGLSLLDTRRNRPGCNITITMMSRLV